MMHKRFVKVLITALLVISSMVMPAFASGYTKGSPDLYIQRIRCYTSEPFKVGEPVEFRAVVRNYGMKDAYGCRIVVSGEGIETVRKEIGTIGKEGESVKVDVDVIGNEPGTKEIKFEVFSSNEKGKFTGDNVEYRTCTWK
ncbi:hypothetical protein [Inediibacterium massiliense]|uniref:hypothetical protein n=1 Tax=Inediibacterium massiliense TaxID=1658111 RepID=UPI0006B4A88E|nr:hypothetical protein [Inediibacterium massiliense]